MPGHLVTFARCRRGATTLQYASLLSLLAVIGYIAYDGFGQARQRPADQASATIGAGRENAMKPPMRDAVPRRANAEPGAPPEPRRQIERGYAPAAGDEVRRTR